MLNGGAWHARDAHASNVAMHRIARGSAVTARVVETFVVRKGKTEHRQERGCTKPARDIRCGANVGSERLFAADHRYDLAEDGERQEHAHGVHEHDIDGVAR